MPLVLVGYEMIIANSYPTRICGIIVKYDTYMSMQHLGLITPSESTTIYLLGAVHKTEIKTPSKIPVCKLNALKSAVHVCQSRLSMHFMKFNNKHFRCKLKSFCNMTCTIS